MKKLNISPKAKKGLIITGSAVICIGIAAIAMTMTGGTPANTNDTVSSEVSSEPIISIAPIEEDTSIKTQSTAPTFNPEKKENQTTELTTISKPTSQPPEPKIEGDSKIIDGKETPPTNPALTDKNHKPTYKKPPVAPGSKPKPSTSKPSKDKPTNNKPKNGEVKNGKMYDPDFGWIDGTGGGEGTVADDMYEDGVKVGIMD